MLDSAFSWFQGKGCGLVYATADRYNSPSWNMFIHRGFFPIKFREQVKDMGLDFVRLWFDEFYIFGAGTFFLKKVGENERIAEAGLVRHALIAWLGFSAVWSTIALRWKVPAETVPLTLGAGQSPSLELACVLSYLHSGRSHIIHVLPCSKKQIVS